MLNTGLSVKERLFCYYYAKLHNPKEAAVKAGFSPLLAEEKAYRLLLKEPIRKQIIVLLKKETDIPLENTVRSGYERAAFGQINDGVKLILFHSQLTPQEVDELDLFSVSEIKKGKDGAFEIKFCNRMEALDKLSLIRAQSQGQEEAGLFYSALEQGALAIQKMNTAKEDSYEV